MNILLLFGVALLCTVLSSYLFVRFKLPQVIGHLLVGVVLGQSFFNIITIDMVKMLTMVSYFALALIGFNIGGELRWARVKRFGASILIITFFESVVTCLLVFIPIYFLTNNLPLALILGGLACATAPGGTTNVINEFKARGQLTSTLFGVVGADDALAIILFSVLSGVAKMLIGAAESITVVSILSHILTDIGGAILLGIILGLIFSFWTLQSKNADVRNLLVLVAIFLCSGLAVSLNVSLILSTMVMGIIIANIRPHRARPNFSSLYYISTPVYMLFFVLIGARLDYKLLMVMGSIGVTYFLFRTVGKYFGAFIGAYIANVPKKVRQNIGLCLLSQAGVAIGLAISLDIEFSKYSTDAQNLAQLVLTIITASTLIFQIVGPIMTKYALTKANETNV
ncbi:MAG: cation:proton antiporter [Candidatus Margulisiibacteriota bacterium]|nr:cation:proton antiporter [Candidatus Margulisiibacteriota bacterium]